MERTMRKESYEKMEQTLERLNIKHLLRRKNKARLVTNEGKQGGGEARQREDTVKLEWDCGVSVVLE